MINYRFIISECEKLMSEKVNPRELILWREVKLGSYKFKTGNTANMAIQELIEEATYHSNDDDDDDDNDDDDNDDNDNNDNGNDINTYNGEDNEELRSVSGYRITADGQKNSKYTSTLTRQRHYHKLITTTSTLPPGAIVSLQRMMFDER